MKSPVELMWEATQLQYRIEEDMRDRDTVLSAVRTVEPAGWYVVTAEED